MKLIKQIAVSVLLIAGICCAVLYTSCSKNACSGITCLYNAPCSGGVCTCPTGIGGTDCQTVYRLLYSGTYTGIGSRDTGSLGYADSATMVFSSPTDSVYTNMTVVITDSAHDLIGVSCFITLSNFSSSGANFTLQSSVTADTTTIIAGTGSISATSASLNLTTRDKTDTLYHTISYNNFNREP